MAARISSCCEYRYAPGFQQGRKSCFRLSWLTGGIPCHRSGFILSQMDSTSLVETGKPSSKSIQTGSNCWYLTIWMHILWREGLMFWCWYTGGNMYHCNTHFFKYFGRCTSLRNKYSSCQKLNSSTKQSSIPPPEQSPGNSTKPGSEHLTFPSFLKLIHQHFLTWSPVFDLTGLV